MVSVDADYNEGHFIAFFDAEKVAMYDFSG
jgi:hypothetical protein